MGVAICLPDVHLLISVAEDVLWPCKELGSKRQLLIFLLLDSMIVLVLSGGGGGCYCSFVCFFLRNGDWLSHDCYQVRMLLAYQALAD